MIRLALAVLWLLGLCGCGATAGHGLVLPALPAYVSGANPLFPTNSYDANIRNLLLSGKVAEALGYAKEHYGRVPDWLRSYAAAFDAAKRAVGQCQGVAKAIHEGMTQVGQKPEYLALRANWDFVVFKAGDGKQHTVTHNGYHVVVKAGEKVYDAYTGPAGMKLSDYLARIFIDSGAKLETAVVATP